MTDIAIPYGKSKINISIPANNLGGIITDDLPFTKREEAEIIKSALENPINSEKLSVLAADKKNAVILASDITRPSPSYKFLPFIVDELKYCGITEITVILGLGIHRGHTDEEKKKLVGEKVWNECKVIDSDKNNCRFVGKTSYNTPVELFEGALGADLLIATGNIEYHYFAGYSGGAKAVMPGISSHAAISNNHSYMLCDTACPGNIKDNPVRSDIEEAGRLAGIDFIFNVILDDSKNIIDAVAGSNNQAFIEGVFRYDRFFKKEINRQSDIIITSPGGFPKDINLYQSHKALENVKEIVKPGGVIVLVAKCEEGFGEETFEKWMFKAKNYELCRREIEKSFVLGGHKAVAISKIISSSDVMLFSDFNEEITGDIGFKKLNNLQYYIDNIIQKDKDTKITVLPTGRLVKYRKI